MVLTHNIQYYANIKPLCQGITKGQYDHNYMEAHAKLCKHNHYFAHAEGSTSSCLSGILTHSLCYNLYIWPWHKTPR
jgi:hypothetical protein